MVTKSTTKPKKTKAKKPKPVKKTKPKTKTESYDDLYKKIIDLELKIDEIEKIMS
ncbi:MAG: hypothetical protein OEM28_08335 [Nitrosopumilus sp.]|nr:hypothetical protein [Nitrosopumilus sp.]MDH3487856.1 hypothetical protein [Nitrosopumilus sp.]